MVNSPFKFTLCSTRIKHRYHNFMEVIKTEGLGIFQTVFNKIVTKWWSAYQSHIMQLENVFLITPSSTSRKPKAFHLRDKPKLSATVIQKHFADHKTLRSLETGSRNFNADSPASSYVLSTSQKHSSLQSFSTKKSIQSIQLLINTAVHLNNERGDKYCTSEKMLDPRQHNNSKFEFHQYQGWGYLSEK